MSAGCILLSAYVVSGVSLNNFRTDKNVLRMRPRAWKDLLKWNAGERNESLTRCVTHSRSQDKGISCMDQAVRTAAGCSFEYTFKSEYTTFIEPTTSCSLGISFITFSKSKQKIMHIHYWVVLITTSPTSLSVHTLERFDYTALITCEECSRCALKKIKHIYIYTHIYVQNKKCPFHSAEFWSPVKLN